MILNKVNFSIRRSLLNLCFRNKVCINTQIIKQYQKQLQKTSQKSLKQYPKTFEQKMVLLNDPKTIQLLEIVQFGVKYKKGYNWLIIGVVLAGLAGYILQKVLPVRANDRYFAISPESDTYIAGYLFAGFNFQRPFYIYAPLLLGVYQLSRFINVWHLGLLMVTNCLVGDVVGQYFVNKRVSQYQIWENQNIKFGEGNLLAFVYAFWSYIGFKDAFTHLKSKIFLKTVRGKGIVRRGIPFGYLCVIYTLLQILFYQKGAKNSQVVFAEIINGIIMGLLLRKMKPLLK